MGYTNKQLRTFKMSTPSNNNPSLCIPRVFPNITWKRVKDVFEDLGLGEVERVDMVNKTNRDGERFKRVFVHFKRWNRNDTALQVKEKVLSGDSIKVVYDDPWFWKVFKSNAPKPEWNNTKKTKPRISHDERGNKHPGRPTPARKMSELEELKSVMREQRREMERMRDEIERMTRSTSPGYHPMKSRGSTPAPLTPPRTPITPRFYHDEPRVPSPPPLVRQTAQMNENIDDFRPLNLTGRLERASTEMSPETREKVEAEAARAASPPLVDKK